MLNKIISNAISAVLALGIAGTANANTTNATHAKTPNADAVMAEAAPQGGEKCYGVAKAGLNDCATSRHNCSGEAKQSGGKEEWVTLPSGSCSKIVNGKTE